MGKISVVIPVYNAQSALCRCLDSIKKQTYKNYEVILVNDGSSDSSKEICEEYAKKDTRFKVINQANAGVSAARNNGIAEANGKYLYFMDADDYIEENTFEIVMQAFEESNADMVVSGYYIENSDRKVAWKCKYSPGVYSGEECKKIVQEAIDIHTAGNIPPYSWIKFVNKEFWDKTGLKFDAKIRRSEDYFLWTQFMFQIKKICLVTDKQLYHYVDNVNSIVHNYVDGYWEMAKIIYHQLLELLPQEKEIKDRLDMMLAFRSFIAMNNAVYAESDVIYKKEMRKILKDSELAKIFGRIPLKKGMKMFGVAFLLMRFKVSFAVIKRYDLKRKQPKSDLLKMKRV